jgi:hypothetical protein
LAIRQNGNAFWWMRSQVTRCHCSIYWRVNINSAVWTTKQKSLIIRREKNSFRNTVTRQLATFTSHRFNIFQFLKSKFLWLQWSFWVNGIEGCAGRVLETIISRNNFNKLFEKPAKN